MEEQEHTTPKDARPEERTEQVQSFQELIQGQYREDYLKALEEALSAQARETERYLAYRELIGRAEALKAEYPDFDLERELENPTLARLVENGVDLRTAYQVVRQEARSRREARLAQHAARPQETGLGGAASALSKPDPRNLTRQERRALRRRAARGEEIVW